MSSESTRVEATAVVIAAARYELEELEAWSKLTAEERQRLPINPNHHGMEKLRAAFDVLDAMTRGPSPLYAVGDAVQVSLKGGWRHGYIQQIGSDSVCRSAPALRWRKRPSRRFSHRQSALAVPPEVAYVAA